MSADVISSLLQQRDPALADRRTLDTAGAA
jgi:hypothetical protein